MTYLAAPFNASPSFPAPSIYPQRFLSFSIMLSLPLLVVTAFIIERKGNHNRLRSSSNCAILLCLDIIADGLSPQLYSLQCADREVVHSFLPSMAQKNDCLNNMQLQFQRVRYILEGKLCRCTYWKKILLICVATTLYIYVLQPHSNLLVPSESKRSMNDQDADFTLLGSIIKMLLRKLVQLETTHQL